MGEVTQQVSVEQCDWDAAERFGNAWRMNSPGKYGLANLLAAHRLQALEAAAKVAEMWDHRGDIAAAIRALGQG